MRNSVFSNVFFGGAEGNLEGRFYKPSTYNYPVVLILPPDPAYGGSVDNEIVQSVADVFVECGYAVLTFNYRGVGSSVGVFRTRDDAVYDANVALEWLESVCTGATHFWIVGYSFGCWVASNLVMRRPEIEYFVFVSPIFSKQDFSIMFPSLCCGCIITGEKDEFTPIGNASKCVEKMNNLERFPVDLRVVRDAGHLYAGCIDALRSELIDYVNTSVALRVAKPVRKKRRKRKKKDSIA